MNDKRVRVRNRSKRSFFGFSEGRFIVFLTFALFLICQNSLAVDDVGSVRPDCIATLISDIGDRKSHGLVEIQSSLLTDVTLGQVKAHLNGRISVYVGILTDSVPLKHFGVLDFTPTGGILRKFGGSEYHFDNNDTLQIVEVFDTPVDAVMAAARSAFDNGKTGFIGFVKIDERIEQVIGEVQSVGDQRIQVLEVGGEVRKIDPAQLYWNFKRGRYLRMGLKKGVSLYSYLEPIVGSDSIIHIFFLDETSEPKEVIGKITAMTSLESEALIGRSILNVRQTDIGNFFNAPETISILVTSEESPDIWLSVPLTKIVKVIGPLFRLNETSE